MPRLTIFLAIFWIGSTLSLQAQPDSSTTLSTSKALEEIDRLISLNRLAKAKLSTEPNLTLTYGIQVLELAEDLRKDANERGDVVQKQAVLVCEADAHNNIGLAYKSQNNYKKATRSFRQGLRAAIRADYRPGEAFAAEQLRQLGKGEGLEAQIARTAREAKSVLKEEKIGEKIKGGFEDINRNIAENNAQKAEQEEDLEKAIRNYDRAIGYYESDGDTARVNQTYRHMATLAERLGKTEDAIGYRKLASRRPEVKPRAVSPKNIDEVIEDFKAISSEIQVPHIPTAEELETEKARDDVLEEAEKFARSGDFEASRRRFLEATELQKRLLQIQAQRLNDSIETAAMLNNQTQEIEMLTQQQQLKEEQMRRNSQFRNFLAISLILLIAIAGLVSYLFFTKRKAHSQVSKAYSKLEETHRKLQETQTQLVASEKMASLGQLTAGIAHEINNPVNFISGNIDPLRSDLNDLLEILKHYEEIIEKENLAEKFETVQRLKEHLEIDYVTEEIQSLLEGIDEGAHRTAAIVKGLRTFARMDENDRKPFDVHSGLDSTLALLKNQCDNIPIIKDYHSLPMIEGYPGKINQVFMNVLNNAIQAQPKGGEIHITTQFVDDNAQIIVKDKGYGISPEDMEKIFEPFFTTKQVGDGTGLGLSISLGIIEDHKGTIDISSEPGKGTEVVITLPVRYQDDEAYS